MTFLCGGTLSLMAIAGASAHHKLMYWIKAGSFHRLAAMNGCLHVYRAIVHQDLLDHGRLPDPFYGMNEQKVQWVEKEDWLYRTVFTK